jgi:hypothetical protein
MPKCGLLQKAVCKFQLVINNFWQEFNTKYEAASEGKKTHLFLFCKVFKISTYFLYLMCFSYFKARRHLNRRL